MADWSSTVQPRRVLGIDTGFAHIGYALIEVDDFARQTLVDYGVWDMHSAYERMNERSVHAMRQLNTILDKLKFDGIVLETVPGGKTKFNAKGYHPSENTDVGACIACAACARTCPDAVIRIEKE